MTARVAETHWFDFRPDFDCPHRLFRGLVKSLQTIRLNRLRPGPPTSDIIWRYIPYRADKQLLHNPRTIKSQFHTRSFSKLI